MIRQFYYPVDYAAVVDLWEHAGPGVQLRQSDSFQEIAKKVQRDPDLFLVAEHEGRLVGTVMGGFDGRRGMIYHLTVAQEYRQRGIGAALMEEVERRLKVKGCLKSYLLVVSGDKDIVQFYKKRGWQEMDLTILGKEL